MRLQLPFEATLVLGQTSLRADHPAVWRRYEGATVIRYSYRQGFAQAFTDLECDDMPVIWSCLDQWLDHELPRDQWTKDMRAAARAMAVLTQAIAKCASLQPCH